MVLPQISFEDIKKMIELVDKVKVTAEEVYIFYTDIAEKFK